MTTGIMTTEWDTTDVQSMSDASTMMPDIYGRSLRRALDSKLKKLRSLLTADEDITTELDRIVCRLMKLALRTSKDHQMPPPATWMQRKLLDLLSLTEKSIERRRKHFIENYTFKAIGYDRINNLKNNIGEGLTLSTIQNDDTADKIVDKYLMISSDPVSENFIVKSEVHYTEDNLSVTSNETEPFTLATKSLYGEVRLESIKSENKEEIRLEITQGWVDEDYAVTSTNDYTVKSNVESSDSNTSNDSQYKYNKVERDCASFHDEKHIGSNLPVGSKNKISKFAKTNKKGRQGKNKLFKKVSKKHSRTDPLPRSYSKKFEFVEYKSYTFNKPKRNINEHHNLQPTLSKPIPRSLIELCYQDVSTEKSDKLLESSLRRDNICDNMAATKESFLIDIVTEGLEESFALRRSIATEVDQKSDIMESEAIFETVINVTKEDSFEANHVVPFETVNSETIFLYDLNEPSTSKGIRHVSADAQCGTDMMCSISSAVNVMNLPNKCETGIKIGDSFTKLTFEKKSIDFGTVTDRINFYYDLYTINAIKIKDSDEKVTKTIECSTMTQDIDFKLDKKLIKPILNVQTTRDSTSELRMSSSNLSKFGFRCLKNPSDTGMSQKISVTKYIKPKLSYCGIHVHSYRDRQVSEDIVFQGEWQKKGSIVLARKSAQSSSKKRESVIKRKKVNSKEKVVCPPKQQNQIKVSEKLIVHKQSIKYTKLKQDTVNKNNTNKKRCIPNNVAKTVRNNNKVSKVASKIVTSVTTSRSMKNICATKNQYGVTYMNHNNNYSQKINSHKKYEPPSPNNKNSPTSCTTNRSRKCAELSKFRNKIVLPAVRSKTKPEQVKDNSSKFCNEKRKNITYLVFRNEIENSRSTITSSANSKAMVKKDNSKNDYDSTSQNSSPCSSPNSTVTIRPLSVRSKTYCNKRTSPERNDTENVSEQNIDHCKNKGYLKNTKNTQSTNQPTVSCENKENLPYVPKKNDTFKDLDKSSKSLINDRNQNVFMLQVRAESPSSIHRKKSENAEKTHSSSNTKILKNKNTDSHQRVLSPSSYKKSPKNTTKSPVISKEDTSGKMDEICGVSTINNLTRSSTPIMDKIVNIEGQEVVNEPIHGTKSIIKRSNSKINAAMKQLIEERLSFIKRIQDNNDSDSETIILSRDDQNNSIDESLSPISYKTVTNEDTCNISSRDIENALLNCSFESNIQVGSNLDSLATLESTDSRIPVNQTDLLSFTSAESMSNYSEFLIHGSELDKTLTPQKGTNPKTVRDLFERKDQPALKNAAGPLAVQVFSGFSVDGEPIVGDQPEYTRLVDPETENLTLEIARQATSEELFVSGRSSDTYESCYVEDDAFLPNWLFHIISQQQSAEIPEEEQEPENVDLLAEAEFDVNGNMVDAGFGAGVGAGDGHGMHSDQSQDSSGRGTSISSSDVSSGPQSEAILIDPSAFIGPVARTGPTVGSTVVPLQSSDTSFRTVQTMGADDGTQYRENTQRRLNRTAVASDADADVSSLGTDAADSDN